MKRLVLFLTSLLVLAGTISAQAPQTIKGKVTFDEDGSPLPGVSVFVKGSTVGAVTEVDGTYVITGVPSNAKTLVISYIGMLTQELPVAPVVNVV